MDEFLEHDALILSRSRLHDDSESEVNFHWINSATENVTNVPMKGGFYTGETKGTHQ